MRDNINRKPVLLCGLTALALSAAAFAGSPPAATDTHPTASAASTLTGSFGTLDTNNDGKISKSEAAKDSSLNNQFAKLDTNNDGKLSRIEYDASATSSVAASTRPGMSGYSNGLSAQTTPGKSGSSNGMASSATAQSKFTALDTNNDGSISKSEAGASNSLDNEFAKLDSNKDNKLSMTEFMSATNLASIKVDKKTKGY